MAKDKITEYDATADNNTVVGDVNLAENSMNPSDVNNAIREVMSHQKEAFGSGTPLYVDQTNNRVGVNKTPTVALDVSGSLSVDGGTIKLDGNYPTGTANVALGDTALDSLTSGGYNVAIGNGTLSSNTSANGNNAVGHIAMAFNTTGATNNAFGNETLTANTTGSNNLALGHQALASNTTASNNTAVGSLSLDANTTGTSNVALGRASLTTNTTGSGNVGIGVSALEAVSTGGNNTAVGNNSLVSATGSNNTAFGNGAGSSITSGTENTIIGSYNGNQGGLDIRTLSNRIILSDGDGTVRNYVNNLGWTNISNNLSSSSRFNSGASSSHVVHRTGGDITQFIENSDTNNPYGVYIHFSGASPDNNGEYFLLCQDSTTARLIIRSDGDVQNHDNSYSAISDVKLKEQITDASSQWEDIKALTVRKYKMKTDVATGDSDAHWRLGVIAQEVETAGMGGLVSDSPDLDENNNDLGTTTKTVKYSILYMKAVKALQEAMARIETLEQKVATLQGN